jgi:hypothetical protein
MKRLVRKLAVAAVGSLMVVALAGCDLLGTMQKSGPSPQLTKHRFSPPATGCVSLGQAGGDFVPVRGLSSFAP